VRLFDTGNARKSDPTDAQAVAMVVLRTPGLNQLGYDEELVALRLLVNRRDGLTHLRVQTVNRSQRLLTELFPCGAKRDLLALQVKRLLATVKPRRTDRALGHSMWSRRRMLRFCVRVGDPGGRGQGRCPLTGASAEASDGRVQRQSRRSDNGPPRTRGARRGCSELIARADSCNTLRVSIRRCKGLLAGAGAISTAQQPSTAPILGIPSTEGLVRLEAASPSPRCSTARKRLGR
jgi:hypothetical protein